MSAKGTATPFTVSGFPGTAKVPINAEAGSTSKSSAVACLYFGRAAKAGLIAPKSVRDSSTITTAFPAPAEKEMVLFATSSALKRPVPCKAW